MSDSFLKYLQPFVLCGWLFLFLSGIIAAQDQRNVKAIQFVGNDRYSHRELSTVIGFVPDKETPLDLMRRSTNEMTELYRKNGFYNFRFDSISVDYADDSLNIQMTFFIREGTQSLIHTIDFIGNRSASSSQMLAMMETSVGNPLDEQTLESDIRSILNFYSDNGRPFAKILSDSISIDRTDSSRLLLSLVVVEGPSVFLNEIQIEGNTTTKTDVIVREARMEPLAPFQQERIDRVKRRLDRMQLFASVSQPQLYIATAAAPDSLIGGLSISVQEGNPNTFDGIVGYVPSNIPGAKGYFTGDVFVLFRNLFGTGRTILR